ncbi:hypothetical protein RHGRI_031542 [Rhododendron griersonianum]|uniref:Uncharacterized protein n=1 Tax=Rhododendron griersonianum TaxID=479676 RepID=A0AAV6IE24_9ERIC|nr:hypothetical protein RHGRI_031542 [Rhododendron griersonianum]
MASPAACNVWGKISPTDESAPTSLFPTPILPSSRRTHSLFSYSPLRSLPSGDDTPLFAPSTPLCFAGIPFSWESLPGIPKKQVPMKKDYFPSLPLPPARTPKNSPKKSNLLQRNSEKDPFFKAMVECSKDVRDPDLYPLGNILKGSRVNRTLSGRFGCISEKASCKGSCAVSESIIFIPRPGC